ncbi:hypothetical protein FIBSPDRAFT_871909 [Athelia psychrophila]|uniref:Uncharacterized protein n=1 Tax=Athelia psychrophila TaxID=1759441 RepID=A0A166A150_9AGAM|nr:hypothetical protein FIBSPDRAFT_871909 [Fibularhizoctonia sp. CBS 109695]
MKHVLFPAIFSPIVVSAYCVKNDVRNSNEQRSVVMSRGNVPDTDMIFVAFAFNPKYCDATPGPSSTLDLGY